MLLAIVALFLLCNGLAFCNSILESIMLIEANGQESDSSSSPSAASDGTNITANAGSDSSSMMDVAFFERAVEVSNVLITLNSSTSTLVYIIFSSKYRLIFLAMLGMRKRMRVSDLL